MTDTTQLPTNPYLRAVPHYVRGKSTDEVRRELGLTEILKLGSNESLLGPSPQAVAAVQRAAADLHLYPGVEVHDLREQLAASLGPGFSAEHVIVGNGSADVLHSIAAAYAAAGTESIIPFPAFQWYEMATRLYGGECLFVNARPDFTLDLPAMADRISARTRLIFINSPHNPTGTYVTQAEMDDFLSRVPAHVLVVFDEAYREFAVAPDFANPLPYVLQGRNVVVTRTFSKIYGLAGMRVGYGLAAPAIIADLLQTLPAFHSGRLPMLAAQAALADREHFQRARQMVVEGREYLYQAFTELGLKYVPSQGNYIMLVDLPHPVAAIDRAMLQRGLILRPCAPFGLPECLRITVGPRAINERLVAELRTVLAQL